jgi:hypothetical protein
MEVSQSAWCCIASNCLETECLSIRRGGNRWIPECTDDRHRAGARVGRIMRDLTTRGIAASSPLPKGLAFEIADLLLIGSWAALHALHMSIGLDHGVEDEEYEEVITFHAGKNSRRRLIVCRNEEAVFVQPLVGRKEQHDSMADALESLLPQLRTRLTDITASEWPG